MTALYGSNDVECVQSIADDARTPFRRDFARLIHSSVFRRLQGKTQLFPGEESDFFRNRLTHSLEVAQIAKSIASRINSTNSFFRDNPIDLDLVETAALAHDLGHPPFGHNGEMALDDCMKKHGGFEGNAQTLWILTRLEKKEATALGRLYAGVMEGSDYRLGLNLCFRTLASALKYDREIPLNRNPRARVVKGFYGANKEVIRQIKDHVVEKGYRGKLKTIECQIMDIADDIAYSTYDLEDAFKAGFLSPLEILGTLTNRTLSERVIRKSAKAMGKRTFAPENVLSVFLEQFGMIFPASSPTSIESAVHAFLISKLICSNGYVRTAFTSQMVNQFIEGVEVTRVNRKHPVLSEIALRDETKKKVEVLKHFTYEAVIMSPRLKIAEHRGYDIVKNVFRALDDPKKGVHLLPEDFRNLYFEFKDPHQRKRVICDFVAGMTDRYAVEFYCRLNSENAQSIFKPF